MSFLLGSYANTAIINVWIWFESYDGQHIIQTDLFTESSEPESKKLYKEESDKVDKWIGLYHTAIVKVTIPLGGLPIAIYSYYTYYTTDMGADAFQLPFLIEWVPLNPWYSYNFRYAKPKLKCFKSNLTIIVADLEVAIWLEDANWIFCRSLTVVIGYRDHLS